MKKTARRSQLSIRRGSGRGLQRALNRRGSLDERTSPLRRRTGSLADGAVCERCGAVYRRRSWRPGTAGERRWVAGFEWTVCPACTQVAAGQYFGRLILRGRRALQEEAEIRRRIQNVAARAQFTQPERRIVSVERRGETIEVLTTSQKLAHRIVQALLAAFGGKATYAWSDTEGELRATWTWHEERPPRVATRSGDAGGTAAPDRAVRLRQAAAALGKRSPQLDIRCRHVGLDPAWRALISEQLAAWAFRYPDLVRLRFTLTHGHHHRQGVEEAAAQAVLARGVLHATKEAESMPEAIRDALRTIGMELQRTRRGRRKVVRRRPLARERDLS